MPLVPAILLLACLATLAWMTWRDARQYARFKSFTETADRQRFYRRWLVGSVLLFIGGSLLALALTGRLRALTVEPTIFLDLTRRLRLVAPVSIVGPELLGGIVGGMTVGAVLMVVLSQRSGRKPVQVGDIGALMPRNGAEAGWTFLLSINAGISEELFFRLALPLLLVLTFGKPLVAYVVASAVFGLAHVYQGWIGVVVTAVVGAVLAALYLWTGALVVPIVLHALVDLLGLVVRPVLARRLARR
ncbi:MAG TPA: type II CAAX endopeptidase family protein [Caulobacteraceae bacterium]|jgi:membrane protease YdiL (CAAX protease family)